MFRNASDDVTYIEREDLSTLQLLDRSFYSHAYYNGTDIVLRGYIGPVEVKYFPRVDHLVFIVNESEYTIEGMKESGCDPLSVNDVNAKLMEAFRHSDQWKY
jgi:hypothetical protein